MPVCPNPYPAGLFADPTGSVTPFVPWIKEYPLPDGLKMPSHVGSYDGKRDPDNFLHLFEGAIHDTLQILGLHEDRRISGFVHGLKARNLVEHLSTDLPSTYKGLMEKTYIWIEAREVATNGAPNDQKDNFERSRKSSWDNGRGQRSRDRLSPYRGPNHGFLSNLSKSPREILATEKGHDTNQCGELKHQIEEAVKSRRLAHLVKDIKKKKEKVSDTQLGERKEERKKAKPAETHVLMISRKSCNPRKRYAEEDYNKVGEITFLPVTKDKISADPVIIKACVSGIQVNRVYKDSGSLCEVIYDHSFEVEAIYQIPLSRLKDFTRWLLQGILLALGRSTFGNHNWRRPPHSHKNAQLCHREI
ncbi:hypothetical protein Tco_0800990 [Tanacetum coccineum]|uniref:Uncharacterized protein n=1 Tax=Tanacetum coccineum TaxID=301880 RepID=A0ABQ4ZVM6_9ASTR